MPAPEFKTNTECKSLRQQPIIEARYQIPCRTPHSSGSEKNCSAENVES
jgi:hypothetical protein